jgi:hypothetical protein
VFVYGKTCSGKTFTTLGEGSDLGVFYLSLQRIFDSINAAKATSGSGADMVVSLSYFEIYQEAIRDLLEPTKQGLEVVYNEKVCGCGCDKVETHDVLRV